MFVKQFLNKYLLMLSYLQIVDLSLIY